LKAELSRLEAELARYAEAIATAGPLESILSAIKAGQVRHDAMQAEVKPYGGQRRTEVVDTSRIRATLGE